jgi:hypothetical protein
MNTQTKDDLQPTTDQIIYANLLLIGVWVGIFLLAITYLIYVTGLLTPHVDISLIPQYWGKGVGEYLEATNSPHGWGWVSLLNTGDFLNFIGLALLATMTVICYMVLLRGYIHRGNRIFSTICILEILVLCLAASGILGAGGH